MTAFGPVYVPSSGSVAGSGTWASLANAEGSGTGTFTTWTSTTSGATAKWDGIGFDFSTLPAGAVLDSFFVEIQHKESSTTVISALSAQLSVNSVNVGSAQTLTRGTTSALSTFTISTGLPTTAILISTGANVIVTATHNASTTSGVESIDFARITVNYHISVPLIPNNLLTVADQSVESGVGDWVAGANTTLASSGTQFYDGALSLRATSTASGNIAVQWNVTPIPVTAGTTYEFSFQVWSPVSTTCNAEVDWYNGATFVNYDDLLVIPGVVTPIVSGWNTVVLRAPAVATSNGAVPIVIPLATAAGQAFYVDALYLGPPQVTNVPAADTGHGVDAAAVKAAIPAADTGVGVDAAGVVAAIPAPDTGAGVDAASVVFPPFPAADAGSGVDAAALVAKIPATDTGAGVDAATVAALIPATDVGSFVDAAGVSASIPAADTGVGADSASAGALTSAPDSGVGVDAATVSAKIPATDVGSFADTAGVTATIPASDTFAGVDAASAGALAPGSDTGSGVESATIRLGVADSATGVDAATIGAQIPATDTAAGVDSASVRIPGAADTFTGVDTARVIIVATDTGTAVDAAGITATIPAADTAVGVDALVRPITAADTGHGVDSATVIALGQPSSLRTVVIDAEPRVQVILAEPRRLTVDPESRLTLIGADQRTLVVPAEPRIYTVTGG